MTDTEILDSMVEKAGGVTAFKTAMGVSRQSVWEWRTRLTDSARLKMYLWAEENDFRLPKDFLKRAVA